MTSPRDDSPLPFARDIFAADALDGPPDGQHVAGVHGRRQSSVLFTLDELGRETGPAGAAAAARGPGGGGAFGLTETSGLIDIRAAATARRGAGSLEDPDPFGSGGLVLGARGGSATAEAQRPSTMAVPIVRRRGIGPWILAAVFVIVGGGVALALILGREAEVALVPTPTPPPVVEVPAVTPPVAHATPPVVHAEPKPAVVAEVLPTPTPTPTPTPAVTPTPTPAVAPPTREARAEPHDRRIGAASPPKTTTPVEPPAIVDPPPTAPKGPTTPENTRRVNRLMESLDPKATTTPTESGPSDADLPERLSAATVRNALKGRFGACAAKVGAAGPVSVMTAFVISGSGVVSSARVTDAGGVGSDVQSCVVGAIKGTTFPKFKSGSMSANLPIKLL